MGNDPSSADVDHVDKNSFFWFVFWLFLFFWGCGPALWANSAPNALVFALRVSSPFVYCIYRGLGLLLYSFYHTQKLR